MWRVPGQILLVELAQVASWSLGFSVGKRVLRVVKAWSCHEFLQRIIMCQKLYWIWLGPSFFHLFIFQDGYKRAGKCQEIVWKKSSSWSENSILTTQEKWHLKRGKFKWLKHNWFNTSKCWQKYFGSVISTLLMKPEVGSGYVNIWSGKSGNF